LAINQEKRGDSELGSLQFQRAWMFDGLYWEEIADMFETRDRAACSLFQLTEGEVNSIWFLMLLSNITKNVRNLFGTRDRAACSLFQLTEGEVNSIWFLMFLDNIT
jgi:hypothetical protein